MAAPPARRLHARARPGSVERPVNGRLYRGTWAIVGIPVLIAAFSVAKPEALRPAVPSLPPAFDPARALALAGDLARLYPDRRPGTEGARGAARWFESALAPYGLRVVRDPFQATIPGRGRTRLENLSVVVPGRSSQALAVLAHIDDSGRGSGASDNASGVAALIELARAYAGVISTGAPPGTSVATPAHTIFFVATDGGAYGGLGAERFARRNRNRLLATIVLDAIGGRASPRLVLAGDTARMASAGLVETAAERASEQTGKRPGRPSAAAQLLDLAFPFGLYEQAPVLAQGVGALTLTTAGDRPPVPFTDVPERLDGGRIAAIGRAAQELLRSLDQGAELVQGTSSYVYLGPRIVRGWAIELLLVSALLPFLITVVDLFARCRRRRVPLAPALRSFRSRLGFWLWVGLVFELFRLLGVWPNGVSLPLAPDEPAGTSWPVFGLVGLGLAAALGWIVARHRLVPRRPVEPEDELAGHTAALLALGVVSLLVVATNPYALLLLLPSAHAWLWLPHAQARPLWVRLALLAGGFLGPVVLVLTFATRYGLGFGAPWYLLALTAVGFVKLPTVVIALAWAAIAAQFVALTGRRYAPYPRAGEAPEFGPIRSTIRRTILFVRARRRASEPARRALEG
jgi:hypothetical protein